MIIAGLAYLDGRQLSNEDERRLLAAMPSFGRTQRDAVQRAASCIAVARRRGGQEPIDPRHSAAGRIWALDVRPDSLRDLAPSADAQSAASMESVFADAVSESQGTLLDRVNGDFAGAVWTDASRELTLFRDFFGIKKLFYTVSAGVCAWSSVIETVVRMQAGPYQIDEVFVGLQLAGLLTPHRTPFLGVIAVPPGSALTIRAGVVKKHDFTAFLDVPATEEQGSRRTLADYSAEFRVLFSEAVERCMMADGPVVAELSGGLDSSSIVSVADECSRRTPARTSVLTMNWSWRGLSAGDERRYVRELEAKRGVEGIQLWMNEERVLTNWPDVKYWACPRPDFGVGSVAGRIAALRRLNANVVLSGHFGDELLRLSHRPRLAAGHLRRGRLDEAWRQCSDFSARQQLPLSEVLWQYAVRPNLPRRFRTPAGISPPAWVNPDFARRVQLRAYVDRLERERLASPLSQIYKFPSLIPKRNMVSALPAPLSTSDFNVETRYPFTYRPLVRFIMSVPAKHLASAEGDRLLQRRALEGIVPSSIVERTDKGGALAAFGMSVANDWSRFEELFEHSRAVEKGYVTKDAVRAECQRWKHGHVTPASDVFRFAAIEMWLRALEAAGPRGSVIA